MPSPFDDLEQAAQAVIADHMAKLVRLEPMIAVEYSTGTADPERPTRDVSGIFSRGTDTQRLKGDTEGALIRGAGRMAVGASELWIAAADAAAIGYRMRRGDVVALLEEAGQPRFQVSYAQPSPNGDLTLILTAIK